MRCFRCGSKLYNENDEELQKTYPLVCWHCDENMFLFEAVEEYPNEKRIWLEKYDFDTIDVCMAIEEILKK